MNSDLLKEDYFNELNYSLGNEDSSLEIALCQKNRPKKIVSICGSGGRALPLIVEETEDLYCFDLSSAQLALAQLRVQSYKKLSYQDFLKFWGYFPYYHQNLNLWRENIFQMLSLDGVGENEIKYLEKVFIQNGWRSILYSGKWEKTFQILSKLLLVLVGKNAKNIFDTKNVPEQQQYWKSKFPLTRWKFALFILGNRAMFNALLYRGHFIVKNDVRSHFQYYFDAYENLFLRHRAKSSFFLNLCFFGEIAFSEGNPIEALESTHHHLQSILMKNNVNITFLRKDFFTAMAELKNIDFISLSDVPSYFNQEQGDDFLQKIGPNLAPNALVVVRYYLRTQKPNLDQFDDITDQYLDLVQMEKVQMYNIKIYKFVPSNC